MEMFRRFRRFIARRLYMMMEATGPEEGPIRSGPFDMPPDPVPADSSVTVRTSRPERQASEPEDPPMKRSSKRKTAARIAKKVKSGGNFVVILAGLAAVLVIGIGLIMSSDPGTDAAPAIGNPGMSDFARTILAILMIGGVFGLGRLIYKRRSAVWQVIATRAREESVRRIYVSLLTVIVVNVVTWLMLAAWDVSYPNLITRFTPTWFLLNLVIILLTLYATTRTPESKYVRGYLMVACIVALIGSLWTIFPVNSLREWWYGSPIAIVETAGTRIPRSAPAAGGILPKLSLDPPPPNVAEAYEDMFEDERVASVREAKERKWHAILFAESRYQHANPNTGLVTTNTENENGTVDIGEAQINSGTFCDIGMRFYGAASCDEWFAIIDENGIRRDLVWWANNGQRGEPTGLALDHGLNIIDVEGNRAFAKELYSRYGFARWESSRGGRTGWERYVSNADLALTGEIIVTPSGSEDLRDAVMAISTHSFTAHPPKYPEDYTEWINRPSGVCVWLTNPAGDRYQVRIVPYGRPGAPVIVPSYIPGDPNRPFVNLGSFIALSVKPEGDEPVEILVRTTPYPPEGSRGCFALAERYR